MPTYRIVTLGCKLNQADSAALEARLRLLGLRRAPAEEGPAEGADVVILNTCTVTAHADREARQIARRLRRANPQALLIATGCYAERDPHGLKTVPGIDHVVPLREQEERVPALAAAALGIDRRHVELDLGPQGTTEGCEPETAAGDRTRALLKVQDGCDLRCSYCIIPSVRGASRSVPPRVVLERLTRLVDAGFREIVLTGVNTGDYGRDLEPPLNLEGLLEQAIEVLEKLLRSLGHSDAPSGHVFVDLTLHLLPLLGPEPCLIRWYRDVWAELDHPVVPLDHLHLGPRLIQVVTLPDLGGEHEISTRLDADECSHALHDSRKPVNQLSASGFGSRGWSRWWGR